MVSKGRPPYLLIVEDSPNEVLLFKSILPDCPLVFAANGREALKLLEENAAPALMLLDVTMPQMDGFQFIRHLKDKGLLRDVPVIFVSARNDVESQVTGFALGAVDYITKPFSTPLLRARVRTHLALRTSREALARQNELLEKAVGDRTAQLCNALRQVKVGVLETVLRLSRAAEYKDEQTAAHLIRMSHYAGALGRRLGLSALEVEDLLCAAPMHDIGKIGIPDSILLKPGGLTAMEWQVMKQHTVIGARILAGSESRVIRLGESVARTHHENWDGTGYPCGLKGEQIPLAGRIVAVADSFDAMTTKRSYKDARPQEEAFAEMGGKRGTRYAPQVLDAFLAVKDEVSAIRSRFQTETKHQVTDMLVNLFPLAPAQAGP